MEEWRKIKEFPEYEVSNYGNVRHRERLLTPYKNNKGYMYVSLSKTEQQKRVHRLVAEAFIPNPDNKPFVNHIDTDTTNNFATNLEWATGTENNLNPLTREHRRNSRRIRNNKQVLQKNNQGQIVRIYETSAIAVKELGCDKSDLSKCCRGKINKVKGFGFQYLDDFLADWLEEYQEESCKKVEKDLEVS